jgi:hypothetical protein
MLQFPAKRRKTPQDAAIRCKKMQFTAKCSSTFKQISQINAPKNAAKRRKKLQNAAKSCKVYTYPMMIYICNSPQKATICCKTLQNTAKCRTTPQFAVKRRNSP